MNQTSNACLSEKQEKFPALTEIKKSIPNSCFESSVVTSMYYVFRALTLSSIAVGLFYWARNSQQVASIPGLLEITTVVYILFQGVVFWGYFTIGHDCGHGSFSRYHSLNFIIGNIMHSVILTPFETWRVSHRHHHKNTGNIDKDEIFYPQRKGTRSLKHVRQSIFGLGSAWFLYLRYGYPPRDVPHFNPWHALFSRNFVAVSISLAVYLVFAALYMYLTYAYGLVVMTLYYFAPIFVFASFLVITTFLHHNHEDTPWYAESEWTYVKGNLSSVDRSYGEFIDNISHNIGTHQIHHLFPIIPHYKLKVATMHFRKAFPTLARTCEEPIVPAFTKTAKLYVNHGECDDNVKVYSLGMAAKSLDKAKSD